jgi:enoyl-CoA hydratase
MNTSDEVLLDRHHGVAVLTLNAPQRRNSLTESMAVELIDACEQIDGDPTIGAVVLRGAGGFFCSGGDRSTLAAAGASPAGEDAFRVLGRIYESFRRVGSLQPPSIAAVEGGAVGAGLNLAMATDLRIVSAEAQFLSGFLPIGLHPGGGHATLIGRAGGREVLNAMVLFGESLSGSELAERALAWQALPNDQVFERALELAERAAADPALSRRVVRSARLQMGPPAISWDAGLELERASQMWSMQRKHNDS